MIKKSSIRRICVATLALFILLIIYFFPSSDVTIKEHLSYIKKDEMPIFLVDNSNYVARTSIVKSSETINEQIKEIIETLTINSKKSTYIRDGFKPIIPENTKIIDLKLDNEILTINFSKEFLTVNETNEELMLEALIYSLTELKEIKKIKILVENIPFTKLPNSNKKLPEYLDKTYGINKIYNLNSLKETSKTTIYYLSKINDYYYYVPVTKVSNEKLERVEIIIKELKSTPIYHTNLISYLKASANMTNYELLENAISLSFNNYLIANMKEEQILEEVKYSIALSLRDTYGINEVIFNIPDSENSKISI
ncbi:MAG: GerMN domain-containing protein [Firmicutes bacterium]|jgi:spore germination protein GerM|uniref:GerMN domain-containing protein n=1 Tax=Candidatus Onthocola sp. TaxID=3085646 RepID=UPI0024219792|nr:GerMN domain-containing protein [Bacillota bacterium]